MKKRRSDDDSTTENEIQKYHQSKECHGRSVPAHRAHRSRVDLHGVRTALIGDEDAEPDRFLGRCGPKPHCGLLRRKLCRGDSDKLRVFNRFAYRITKFTGVLRFLASEARGEWWFDNVPGRRATLVRWRYEFVGRSKILKPLLGLFTRSLWRGYMGKALHLSKAQVEAQA